MTTLVLDEIRDTTILSQEFDQKQQRRVHLKAVKLNLYIHGQPSGDITLTLKKNNVTVAQKSLSISTMLSEAEIVNDYVHGYFLFAFNDTYPIEKGLHVLEVSGTNGYTFNENAYAGWIKEHDPLKVNTETNPQTNVFKNPFSYQLWKYRS